MKRAPRFANQDRLHVAWNEKIGEKRKIQANTANVSMRYPYVIAWMDPP